MKLFYATATAVGVLLSGCSDRVAINDLRLPPVRIVGGSVSAVDVNGFTLQDASGSIHVKAELPNNVKLNLSRGEKIEVVGNLEGGSPLKQFDAYIITRGNGEKLVHSFTLLL